MESNSLVDSSRVCPRRREKMTRCSTMRSTCCVVCLATATLLSGQRLYAQKAALNEAIAARAAASWEIAQKIWGWAEPGYQEKRSAALLAQTLEAAGFKVERGVANIPTAFTATIGSGTPVIGILGEYDALPGLSQQAVPVQQT